MRLTGFTLLSAGVAEQLPAMLCQQRRRPFNPQPCAVDADVVILRQAPGAAGIMRIILLPLGVGLFHQCPGGPGLRRQRLRHALRRLAHGELRQGRGGDERNGPRPSEPLPRNLRRGPCQTLQTIRFRARRKHPSGRVTIFPCKRINFPRRTTSGGLILLSANVNLKPQYV